MHQRGSRPFQIVRVMSGTWPEVGGYASYGGGDDMGRVGIDSTTRLARRERPTGTGRSGCPSSRPGKAPAHCRKYTRTIDRMHKPTDARKPNITSAPHASMSPIASEPKTSMAQQSGAKMFLPHALRLRLSFRLCRTPSRSDCNTELPSQPLELRAST